MSSNNVLRILDLKKLVLAYPNLRWHKVDIQTLWNLNPSTLCLLGKMVEGEANVTIIDAQFYDLSIEAFVARIADVKPDYVGISILTSEYSSILHLAAEAIKNLDQNIIVIAGGVHVTIDYMKVMDDLNIDFAVRGEGEHILRDLIRFLNGSGGKPTRGLVYRHEGRIVAQSQELIMDIGSLPLPDYDLVKMEDYINVGSRYGPLRPPEYPYVRMLITRGCPVGCSFCQVESISGRKVRVPDVSRVVDEIAYLKNRYGLKSFIIDDDNIALRKKFFKKFLKVLTKRDMGLKFIIQSFAIFALDDEMLELLSKAGCVGINVAIESGSKRVIKEIVNKPLNLEDVPRLIAKIKSNGIYVLANFIIGFPGETWDEIRETISFAENCGADYVKLFVAVPLKGTKLWDMAKKHGSTEIADEDPEVNWRFSQIKSDEWTPYDISILRAYEWDRINFGDPNRRRRVAEIWGMSEDEISKIRKATRDAVTAGKPHRGEEIQEHVQGPKRDYLPIITDGGNLLIN